MSEQAVLTREGLMPDEEKRGRTVSADEVWVAVRIPRTAKTDLSAWAKGLGVSESLLMRRLLLEALSAGRHERGELP